MIDATQITGLVLAGGRGSRMGGVDKGLQLHRGVPLALHALRRLAPQVGTTLVSANRHLERYAAMGAPVVTDALPDHVGPLAGLLAGLARCTTPYLVSVPCDSPNFPTDLVEHLADGLAAASAEMAIAVTRDAAGVRRTQPVFCLLQAGVGESLRHALHAGQRKLSAWIALHRCAEVEFADADAFANANTLDELLQLERRDG